MDLIRLTDTDKSVLKYQEISKQLSKLYTDRYKNDRVIDSIRIDIQDLKRKMSNFSTFDKLFKRQQYLHRKKNIQYNIEYQNRELKKCQDLANQYASIIEKLQTEKNDLMDIAESSINNLNEEVNRQIKLQIYNDNNGFSVIDDQPIENIGSLINSNFDTDTFSFDDIALVHATDYFPIEDKIMTPKDAHISVNKDIELDGKSYNVTASSHRNSIHFALNGKVSSHGYGNWDSSKYIIIEPIKEHLSVINSISPEDTWTRGSVDLSKDAIILVNENEELDPNLKNRYNIIKFKGDSEMCVNKILLLLGYKPQTIGMHDWEYQETNSKLLNHLVNNNYPEKYDKKHFYSDDMKIEQNFTTRDFILSALRNKKINSSNGLNITLKELIPMFNYYVKHYNSIGPVEKEKLFPLFIRDYGIIIKEDSFYLISDEEALTNLSIEVDKGDNINRYQDFEDLIMQSEDLLECTSNKKR